MIVITKHLVSGVMVSLLVSGSAMANVSERIMPSRTGGKSESMKSDSHRGGGAKAIVSKGALAKTASAKASPARIAAGGNARRPRVQLASLRTDPAGADGARSHSRGAYASMPNEKSEAGSDYVGAYEPAADGHQVGIASWYGGKSWNGHRTSDGGTFSDTQMTAAHATLPMGSLVRVSLGSSERSVVVRITDRPGTRRRIIDLSRAAAAELGMLNSGTAVVMLSPM